MTNDGNNYRVTGPDGKAYLFDQATGKLAQTITPGGQIVQNVYNAQGQLSETYWSVAVTSGGTTTTYVESWLYEYGTGSESNLVTTITLRQRSYTTTPGSWTDVRRILLAYYPSGNDFGNQGDLQKITLETKTASGWQTMTEECFRYYKDDTGNGYQHGLKFVVEPDAWQNMVAASINPLTVSDSTLDDYADYYYEYNDVVSSQNTRRVTKSIVAANTRIFTFTYTDGHNTIGYNSWQLRTQVERSDGSREILFANHVAQKILSDLWQNPSDASQGRWVEYRIFNGDGRLIEEYSPAAITMTGTGAPYTYSVGTASLNVQLESSAGLCRVTQYYSSGDGAGYPEFAIVRAGTSTTNFAYLRKFTYEKHTVGSGATLASVVYVKTATEYRDAVNTNPDTNGNPTTTTFTPVFYDTAHGHGTNTNQVKTRTTTLPTVPTNENGPNSTDNIVDQVDIQGRLTSRTDPRDVVTTFSYDEMTGAITQIVEDSGGMNLTTDYTVDALGRTTEARGPARDIVERNGDGSYTLRSSARSVTWTLYLDHLHQVRSGQGYIYGSTTVLVNPIALTYVDHGGHVTHSILARQSTTNTPVDAEAIPQSDWYRWTRNAYNDAGQQSASCVYDVIPSSSITDPNNPSGWGSEGTNYDRTQFGYDVMGRRDKMISPGGTIAKQTFDARGLPLVTSVGTNDQSGTSNMVDVTTNTYDQNGNLLTAKQHVSSNSSDDRTTTYGHDFRNRQTSVTGEVNLYIERSFDNLDRVRFVKQRNGSASGTLLSVLETQYDARGQVYKTLRKAVNSSGTETGKTLVDNTWRDAGGLVIKSQPAGSSTFVKSQHDAIGRTTKESTGFYNGGGTENPASIADDKIFEQTIVSYDAASNAIQTTTKRRFSGGTGNGDLGNPSTQPKCRVTFVAGWFDGVGRRLALADYGTNLDSSIGSFNRPTTPPTASSSTVLMAATKFNDRGEPYLQSGAAGVWTMSVQDNAGRTTSIVQNYQTSGSGDDVNVTVNITYTPDGQVASRTAVNPTPNGTGDQTTNYIYGSTLTESDIARSDLLIREEYPDSVGESDSIRYGYNRQGEVKRTTDQNGAAHDYTFDKLGRLTKDDCEGKSINRTYEPRGMLEHVKSEIAGSPATIVNDVLLVYNDFGQLKYDCQQRGAAATTSSPKVEYAYAAGSSDEGATNNTARRTSMIYPDGRTLTHDYPSGDADKLSRVASLTLDTTAVAEYNYLGLRVASKVKYPVPIVYHNLAFGNDSVGDPADSLDYFGRLKELRWEQGTGAPPAKLVQLKHGFNTASSRLYRRNELANTSTHPWSELYGASGYDALQRLANFQRGVLNSTNDAISSQSQQQTWTFDKVGNWRGFTQQSAAISQARTANVVNEIQTITNGTGEPTWYDVDYDANGNMTTMPQPNNPTEGFDATYDAWNRLVEIADADGDVTVATFEYDGLHRCSYKTAHDSSGDMTEERLFYYSDDWQVLEERVGSSSGPIQQWVWGLRNIDDCVLRHRDTDSDGTLDEYRYAMQDANWNVVAVTNDSGSVQQRYEYTPYGKVTLLQDDWNAWSGADGVQWEVLLSGYRQDIRTGLYAVRMRLLHPVLGSWLTRDAIFSGRAPYNLYSYVNGNPLFYVDPYGLVDVGIANRPTNEGKPDFEKGDTWNETPFYRSSLAYAGCGGLTVICFRFNCKAESACTGKRSKVSVEFYFFILLDAAVVADKAKFANLYHHELRHVQFISQTIKNSQKALDDLLGGLEKDEDCKAFNSLTGIQKADIIGQVWDKVILPGAGHRDPKEACRPEDIKKPVPGNREEVPIAGVDPSKAPNAGDFGRRAVPKEKGVPGFGVPPGLKDDGQGLWICPSLTIEGKLGSFADVTGKRLADLLKRGF